MKLKNLIINIIILLAALAGAGLLLYPHVGFWLSQRSMSYVIQEYDTNLQQMEDEEKRLQLQLAFAYNANLGGGAISDPFAQAAQPQDAEYYSLLNSDSRGMMGHISIPKIRLDTAIYHGTSNATLQAGIGHMQGTALPVGGQGTHCVLTGHTGLDTAKMFTDLSELALGDEFYIYVMGAARAYKIDNITVVQPHETEQLLPVPGQEYVTLVTCTPYGINSHRLLLRGHYTDYPLGKIEDKISQTQPVLSKEHLLLFAGLAALLLLGILFVAASLLRRKKQRKARILAIMHTNNSRRTLPPASRAN